MRRSIQRAVEWPAASATHIPRMGRRTPSSGAWPGDPWFGRRQPAPGRRRLEAAHTGLIVAVSIAWLADCEFSFNYIDSGTSQRQLGEGVSPRPQGDATIARRPESGRIAPGLASALTAHLDALIPLVRKVSFPNACDRTRRMHNLTARFERSGAASRHIRGVDNPGACARCAMSSATPSPVRGSATAPARRRHSTVLPCCQGRTVE